MATGRLDELSDPALVVERVETTLAPPAGRGIKLRYMVLSLNATGPATKGR